MDCHQMSTMLKSTGVGHFVARLGEEGIDQRQPNFNRNLGETWS